MGKQLGSPVWGVSEQNNWLILWKVSRLLKKRDWRTMIAGEHWKWEITECDVKP